MGVALYPFGLYPPGLWPWWLHSGAGGYLVYRGVGCAANIDWTEPVGSGQAGETTLHVFGSAPVAETVYTLGLRAVSDAGVLSTSAAIVCRVVVDAEGELVGQPPGRMALAVASAAAGGKIRVGFRYDQPPGNAFASAAAIQIAPVVDGAPDWDNPVAEIACNGSIMRDRVEIAGTHETGELVRLAARARTAAGVGGPTVRFSAVADATGPEPVPYLSARQTS